MSIKSLLAALVVSLSLAAPGLAGPYEDGKAAYRRGDYVTALRLWRPLAEQGNALAQYYLGEMHHFYLLEQGRITFNGSPGELEEEEVIHRAYLGSQRE